MQEKWKVYQMNVWIRAESSTKALEKNTSKHVQSHGAILNESGI